MLALLSGACGRPEPVANEATAQPEDVAINSAVTSNDAAPVATEGPSGDPIAYTSLKPADCKLIEQNVEEGGYSRHRCSGIAGYLLETSESDLRQGLTIIAPGGRRSDIDLSARLAKGAFNALGPAAEWRGKDGDAPKALIVRLNVGRPEGGPDTSNLVVVRLGDPVCISSVVPPISQQNEIARRQADAGAPTCLVER